MPVPTSIDDLSTTAASNSPSGSESPTDGDNYIRELSAYIAQLRDRTDWVTPEAYGAVGDGVTNDGAAVVAAVASGNTVWLREGRTYLMNGFVAEPTTGQHIYGPGRLLNTADSIPAQFIKVNGVDDVVIDGVWFDCTGSATRCYGVTTEDAERTTVRNCRSTAATFMFIWKGSSGTRVLNNKIVGGQFGIATGGDAASGSTNGAVSDTLIQGNYISACTSEGIDLNWDTQGCVVDSNVLIGNNTVSGEDDIDIGGGVSSDIVITNNILDSGGNSAWCITVKLDTDRVLIKGNIMRGMLEGGVGNEASGAGVNDISIVGNQIYGGGTATSSGVYGRIWSGVMVADNTITGFTTGDGITLASNVSNATITGNRCNGNGDGIVCLAPQTVITGNRCSANGNGINVQAQGCSVTGNVLINNSLWGLVVTAGSDYAVITGNAINDLRGGSANQDGVTFTGASDRVLMTGNVIYPVQATAVDGAGSLTNSTTTGNITS